MSYGTVTGEVLHIALVLYESSVDDDWFSLDTMWREMGENKYGAISGALTILSRRGQLERRRMRGHRSFNEYRYVPR